MVTPFFTIIIPTYNSAKVLAACLDSVIKQTFLDSEILIIDGASSDDTLSIVNRYAGNHLNIRLVSEEDEGIYDAMNKGIKRANGRWLYFLGSDDILINNKTLSYVYEALEGRNFPDIMYGNVVLGDTNYVHNGEYNICKLYDTNICHQSIFYKSSVFDIVGNFDKSYPMLADWLLNFRCYTHKQLRFEYINLLVAKYCLNGLSSNSYDPLVIDKNRLFLAAAKNSTTNEFLKLRKYMIDTRSVHGKLSYLYYEGLYISALILKKWKTHLKR